jgi:hypothetical protein
MLNLHFLARTLINFTEDYVKKIEERRENLSLLEKIIGNIYSFYYTVENWVWYRKPKYLYQRATQGFADPELWDLYNNLAELIAPRLRAFVKNGTNGCPMSYSEKYHNAEQGSIHWRHDISKMAFAFEKIADDEIDWQDADRHYDIMLKSEEYEEDKDLWLFVMRKRQLFIQEQMENFGKNFQSLWD